MHSLQALIKASRGMDWYHVQSDALPIYFSLNLGCKPSSDLYRVQQSAVVSVATATTFPAKKPHLVGIVHTAKSNVLPIV